MARHRWRRDYTRDIIDLKNRYDDLREHIEEPPEGQVPIGDWGIYTSPNLQTNKPVSPFDCDQYPDSPYCGGTPWTKTPVGLEPEWGVDECGAWIELTPVLGFTKLPPVSVGWRRPGKCREEKKPPPAPPTLEDDGRPVNPLKFPSHIDPTIPVFVVVGRVYKYVYTFDGGWGQFGDQWVKVGNKKSSKYIDIHGLNNTEYPVTSTMVSPYYPTANPVLAIGTADLTYNESKFFTGYEGVENQTFSGTSRGWISSDQKPPWRQYPNSKRYLYRDGELRGNYLITGFLGGDAYEAGSFILYGTLAEIRKDWEGWVSDFKSSTVTDKKELASSYIYKAEWKVLYISIPDPDKFPPPPNQKRRKRCCMQCCSDNQRANRQDRDNAEILKLLRQIKKAIGVDEYPVPMPESLNVSYDEKGKRKEPKMIKEENLTAVVGRFIRYFDGIMGEWGLGFKVADADPTKPGDQPKFITANNVSELMEEVYSHIFDVWIMQYQFLQLDQRHAIESMLARKVGIQNYYLIQSLIDWAGFKTKDITKKIPFLFDIDAKGFEGFLKNKEQEIQVPDFDPDDEGADSFPDHLLRLKRAAAIIEAVHTSKLKKSDDIPKKMMEILLATSEGVDRVNNDELKKAGSQQDFEQWLRDAETAFINRTGQGNINNPYGVPYAERPRLTKISDTEKEEEQT